MLLLQTENLKRKSLINLNSEKVYDV